MSILSGFRLWLPTAFARGGRFQRDGCMDATIKNLSAQTNQTIRIGDAKKLSVFQGKKRVHQAVHGINISILIMHLCLICIGVEWRINVQG